MIKNSLLKMLALFFSLQLINACAQNGGGSGGGGGINPKTPGANKPGTPVNCEQAWAMTLQGQPRGRMTYYENKTFTVIGGTRTLTSQVKIKSTVLENDGSKIIKTVETETIRPTASRSSHQDETTKENFMTVCQAGTTNTPDNPNDLQVRTIGKENITVRAGSFATTHFEMIFSRTNEEVRSDSKTDNWVSDEFAGLLVKSQMHSSSSVGGNTYEMIYESELLQFKR